MKTRNNVQKTAQRFTTVIAALILISLTTAAQDFLKELSNNHFDAIAYVDFTRESNVVASSDNSIPAPFSELVRAETEEALEIEKWMTSNEYFNPGEMSLELENEKPLELENWMTNDNYFNQLEEVKKVEVVNEEEKGLELRSWMLDSNLWDI